LDDIAKDIEYFKSLKDLNLEGNSFNKLPSKSHIYFKAIENLNLNYIHF